MLFKSLITTVALLTDDTTVICVNAEGFFSCLHALWVGDFLFGWLGLVLGFLILLNNEVFCYSSLNNWSLSPLLCWVIQYFFFFFCFINCWFALLPVHMLFQMQLIHEISNLKNLVKHAEVYNQDLEVSIYVGISDKD